MNKSYFNYTDNFAKYERVRSHLIFGNPDIKSKLYTIAIPTFRRANLLDNAIKSVVDQTIIGNYEILIVDNDINDMESERVVRKYQSANICYYKNEENIGMFGNWNRCIELAQGKYITILNDDDWLDKRYLENCERHLKEDVDGLYFRTSTVDFRKNNFKKEKNKWLKKAILTLSKTKKRIKLIDFFWGNMSAGTLGVLMKTEYLKKLGGYNEEYFPSSDYVLHSNYCHKHSVYYISKQLAYYRIHQNESTKQETLEKWEYIDNDIRKYYIKIIGRNRKILLFLNEMIQNNRIKSLIDCWGYHTNTLVKRNIRHGLLSKLISLKKLLNI